MDNKKRDRFSRLGRAAAAGILSGALLLAVFTAVCSGALLPKSGANGAEMTPTLNEPVRTENTVFAAPLRLMRYETESAGPALLSATAEEPKAETTEDARTPWQIKFAEHFTEEPVLTDHSYTSPEVSIEITRLERKVSYGIAVCYVADIYVASLDNFKAATPNGQLAYGVAVEALDLDAQANAILAINGDFFCLNDTGFYVRNGESYRTKQSRTDICVLYPDGVIETYTPKGYKVEEILKKNPVQVWNFGPALLDENGEVRDDARRLHNMVYVENPRSALGYYEPGHYCFVVVDGRVRNSVGLRMGDLAELFKELGCTRAYNMDGGGSTVMLFNHEVYSVRNSNRTVGDLIVITENGFLPAK